MFYTPFTFGGVVKRKLWTGSNMRGRRHRSNIKDGQRKPILRQGFGQRTGAVPSPLEAFLSEESGVSRLLQATSKGDVTYLDQKVYFHSLDRVILQLVSNVVRNKKEAVAVYPIRSFDLLAPLAVEALWICKVGCSEDFGERDRVLLITKRKDSREDYQSLVRSDGMILHEMLPMAVVGLDGECRIMRFSGRSPVYYGPHILVSPSIDVLPSKSYGHKIASVIVDIEDRESLEDIRMFRNWVGDNRIPSCLYISLNPLSEPVNYLRKQGVRLWGWNDDSLRTTLASNLDRDKKHVSKHNTPLCASYPRVMNLFNGVTRVVIPVNEERITPCVIDLRKDYVALKRSIDNGSLDSILRCLLGTVYASEEMLAPFPYAEKHLRWSWGCLPFSHRLKRFRSLVKSCNGLPPAILSYLNGVSSKITNLQELMENSSSGKPVGIMNVIDETVRQNKSAIIAHRIRAHISALEDYLEEEKDITKDWLKEHRIALRSQRELDGNSKADVLVYYGVPRYQYNGILRFAGVPNLAFLIYRSEEVAMQWVLDREKEIEDLFSTQQQLVFLSNLTGVPIDTVRNKLKPLNSALVRKKPRVVWTEPQETDIWTEDDAEAFGEAFQFDELIEEDDETVSTVAGGVTPGTFLTSIRANAIHLEGSKIVHLSIHRKVPIFMPNTKKVESRYPENLRKGDLYVHVHKGEKGGLASGIVQGIKTHPKMLRTVANQMWWVNVLKEGMACNFHSTADVSDKLQLQGLSRTPAAVYQWLTGEIFGPREKDVIVAIGSMYGDKRLVRNIDSVWKAILHLRKLGRRVSSRLEYLAPHAVVYEDEADNQIIDEELNLYLSDFKRIISVERIELVVGPVEVDPAIIGRLQRKHGEIDV